MKNMEEKDKTGSEARVDIADFVFEVDRFTKLIEPFAFCLYFIDDLRRWRNPVLSGSVLLILNLCCVILTKGSMFVFVSLTVICVASVSLFQIHTKILEKVLPDTRRLPHVLKGEDISTLQTIKKFRYSLIEMNDFVIKCNEYLSTCYSILKWDKTLPSLLFHVQLCVFLLSMVVMPTRWIYFLLFNWFFLCQEQSLNYIKQYIIIEDKSKPISDTNGVNTEPVLPKQEKIELKERFIEREDSTDTDNVESSDAEVDNMIAIDPSPNKPGMVARLLELKRRRQQVAAESCFACKVSFTSFLKRRHYCRHCGKDFCNKCCYQKVPRSVFGATSPAAQTETVLVCNICQKLLSSKDGTDKIS